ncbi:hypothetical protein, partial [uncultured Tateyamaria sp.]|uniref:hypothetical protein n=1 Tax=uncultured Tateyamaria sp. TaxID=455651 RepID=UPI00261F7B30
STSSTNTEIESAISSPNKLSFSTTSAQIVDSSACRHFARSALYVLGSPNATNSSKTTKPYPVAGCFASE